MFLQNAPYLPPLWGAFEAQPGSGVQYFTAKVQQVQLCLRDAQDPSLPSAVLPGFWFFSDTLPGTPEKKGAVQSRGRQQPSGNRHALPPSYG